MYKSHSNSTKADTVLALDSTEWCMDQSLGPPASLTAQGQRNAGPGEVPLSLPQSSLGLCGERALRPGGDRTEGHPPDISSKSAATAGPGERFRTRYTQDLLHTSWAIPQPSLQPPVSPGRHGDWLGSEAIAFLPLGVRPTPAKATAMQLRAGSGTADGRRWLWSLIVLSTARGWCRC